MPDWIDKLKGGDDKRADDQRRNEELRLHNAKVIRAKAPKFWNAVIEQIKADSEKLRVAFPHDISRHCDLIQSGDSYRLQGKKLPIQIIEMSLNLDGQCVDILEGTKSDRYTNANVLSQQGAMSITVWQGGEDLQFYWNGVYYSEPELLAERLIKRACQILG